MSKVLIEKRICDGCGMTKTVQISPIVFGGDVSEYKYQIGELDFCSNRCIGKYFTELPDEL